jgi:hypothetical protein
MCVIVKKKKRKGRKRFVRQEVGSVQRVKGYFDERRKEEEEKDEG